jgi:hypothetical protein
MALRLIAQGKVEVDGDRAIVHGAADLQGVLVNPRDRA